MNWVDRALVASLLLATCAAVPTTASAEAPFDLRAMRADHPGAGSVILEEVRTITQPDENTLRIAIRSTRAILDDVGSRSLTLFSETERPGCRVLKGVRIEVLTAAGETLLTSMDDLVRLPQDPFALWKGTRKGVATGALVRESYHIDYSKHCTGGLLATQFMLGSSSVPVVLERIVVDCEDCSVDVTGPNPPAFIEDGDRRVLEVHDQAPTPRERFRPAQTRPWVYVSNSDDPLAWARLVAAKLPTESRRWAHAAPAWAKWARENARGMQDKTAALAYGLSWVPVDSGDSVWKYGIKWGEPVGPGTRSLKPLEWLALSNHLLGPKGGTAVIYNGAAREVPDGAASFVDWDSYGILLPELGLTTTVGWFPTLQGESQTLAGHSAVTLSDDPPKLVSFTSSANTRTYHSVVRVEPSGIASVLVRVQMTESSSWSVAQRQSWLRRVQGAKKRKDDLAEEARDFASRVWFDQRRLTPTNVDLDGPHGMKVETAWTEQDAVISGEGFKLIPIVGYGLPSWLRGLGDERELPIALAARAMSGTVTVQPPSGYRASGLPSNEKVVAGPMSFEAMWTVQGGEPTLTWSLRFNEDSVGPELGPQISALGAAVERTRRAQLVLEQI